MADNEIEINIQQQSNNISVTPKTQQPDLGLNVDYDSILWGTITGDINNQGDLKAALDEKANTADLATVATTGSYNDLTDKPAIPSAQVQSDWEQNDSTKVDYIKNKPDVSGKANLTGGNSFTGTQTVSVENGTNIVRFPGSTTLTYTNISQNSSGLKIYCSGALDPNLYFNNAALLRKTYTISSFPATLATNTNYNATLNGTVSITLPTPSITIVENVINILLNVNSASTIDWGVNANVAMTTFATGKYLIKLRYNNATSNWGGEVLKGESVASTTKAYFSFNDGYADGTGNITLTPVSGYTPTFSAITAFTGRKSLLANNSNNYFTPAFNSPIVLSGPFTIKFWIRKDDYNSFAILADAYAGESVSPYNILSCTRSNMILYGPKSSEAADGYGTVVYNIALTNNLGSYMHYVEISRDSNNTVRLFIDGVVQSSSTYSNDIYVRPTKMFKGSAYLQDFVIEAQVGHISAYNVPTTPYVISDNSLPDYHDKSLVKQIADLTTEINNLKGAIMRRMDFANAVAVNINNSANTYTVPSNGYLQLNYLTSAAASWEYKLNSKSVYISNVELMPVSKDDILGIDSTEFTGLFIPEKTN